MTSKDIISLSQARARLADLCDDADYLDYYHRLEREHIHLGFLDEAIKGLVDVKAGKTLSLAQLTSRHGRYATVIH